MRNLGNVFACLIAAGAATLATAETVSACGTGDVLFEDTLKAPDPSWGFGPDDPSRSLGDDGVTWTVEPNKVWTIFNEASLYEDFEACVDLKMDYPEGAKGYSSLAFWGIDKQNTYVVSLFPEDGAFAIFRLQNGKLLRPVAWTENAAIKKESGAINQISVVVEDRHAVVSVNGTKVTEFNGVPPQGGGLVGIDLGTTADDPGPTKFNFANFQVRAIAQ